MTQKPYDVFVSYCEIDRGLGSFVHSALTSAGLDLYLNVWSMADVPSRSDWQEQMREAMLRAEFVVVLLTRSSLHSWHMAFEVGMAMFAFKPIFVLYDGLSADELPKYVHQHHVADVSQLPAIIDEMKSRLGTMAAAH